MRQKLSAFWRRHWRLIVGSAVLLAVAGSALVLLCFWTVGSASQYIYRDPASLQKAVKGRPVGIVFGGGIDGNKPKPLLQERLDAAAALLKAGVVRKLIVSGDNRFQHYNEPGVMRDYLVEQKQVDPKLIQVDNAGRSTYETCERAQRIFQLDQAVLISEATHLPRALYLCRSFGIEAYGYASTGWAADYLARSQTFRELIARPKAVFNVYFWGENTVLGDPIKV